MRDLPTLSAAGRRLREQELAQAEAALRSLEGKLEA